MSTKLVQNKAHYFVYFKRIKGIEQLSKAILAKVCIEQVRSATKGLGVCNERAIGNYFELIT